MKWVRLSTYIDLVTSLQNTHTLIRGDRVFVFDMGWQWRPHVNANELAIKTATLVMFDRWSDKNDQRRV